MYVNRHNGAEDAKDDVHLPQTQAGRSSRAQSLKIRFADVGRRAEHRLLAGFNRGSGYWIVASQTSQLYPREWLRTVHLSICDFIPRLSGTY
jgi:hypothetical protein